MSNPCSGIHKQRLFVGEGNFSYTEAIINKHDAIHKHPPEASLAHAITASDLTQKNSCDARIEQLARQGVKILFGIDATQLGQFTKGVYKRIHWNCPHDGSDCKQQTLPPIIVNFFKACASIQKKGDRVHVTLVQSQHTPLFYQGYVYDIIQSACRGGYTLLKKRIFNANRYPGYEHTQTNTNEKASVTEQGMKEFVFEKISQKKFERILNNARIPCKEGQRQMYQAAPMIENVLQLSKKNFFLKLSTFYKSARFVVECESDDDSSDCELSDGE